MSRLPAAISNLDLCAAINRLCIHNDPVELTLLTEEQFSVYLNTLPPQMRADICQTINRHPAGETSAAPQART